MLDSLFNTFKIIFHSCAFTAFYLEVLDTLKRAQEEAVSTENLVLEINSLKYASFFKNYSSQN